MAEVPASGAASGAGTEATFIAAHKVRTGKSASGKPRAAGGMGTGGDASAAMVGSLAAKAIAAATAANDYDLAGNAPGSAAAAKAAQESSHRLVELVARLFRIRTAATSWRVGAAGERMVGRRLRRLEARGWRVLHAVPLRSGGDIDHLVIGPGGVFTINTKHHADASIRIGTYVVWVNGTQYKYQQKSLQEARNAESCLGRAVGFPVEVTPMLAFIKARTLTMSLSPGQVMVTSGETIHRTLRRLPTALDRETQDAIYAVARRSRTWLS
ncbi:MAG TPA: nuclease-related domain-containing protein [Actinocrinis sp.]|nr:nuclease-related domain-containing protein [Actinocrinis sp.]